MINIITIICHLTPNETLNEPQHGNFLELMYLLEGLIQPSSPLSPGRMWPCCNKSPAQSGHTRSLFSPRVFLQLLCYFPWCFLFCSSAENFLIVQFACSSRSLSSYASLHLGSLLSLPPVRYIPQLILWETRLWVHTNTRLSLIRVVTWKPRLYNTFMQCIFATWFPQLFINALSIVGSFSGGAVVKNPLANAGDPRDTGSIPGSGRSPGVGNGNLLQYSCLGNPLDRGACQATVQGLQRVRHNYATEHAWARMHQ